MKELLCSFQHTLFSKNLGLRISSCTNDACQNFAHQLTPEICENCDRRQLPNTAELENWNARFLMGYDEGPERDQLMQDWIFQNYCSKCHKYDCVKMICTDCDCPAGSQPIRERARLMSFHCPLKLW